MFLSADISIQVRSKKKTFFAFLRRSDSFHFRCAYFNLDDVPSLDIISLSHVMSMGLNLHFYLLSQTWREEKDEEGGASECVKQQ
jgi:hypothetical protein